MNVLTQEAAAEKVRVESLTKEAATLKESLDRALDITKDELEGQAVDANEAGIRVTKLKISVTQRENEVEGLKLELEALREDYAVERAKAQQGLKDLNKSKQDLENELLNSESLAEELAKIQRLLGIEKDKNQGESLLSLEL